jgi:hypothetical protein
MRGLEIRLYAGFRPISRNFSYNTGSFICFIYITKHFEPIGLISPELQSEPFRGEGAGGAKFAKLEKK